MTRKTTTRAQGSWDTRIKRLLSKDVDAATAILMEADLTPEEAVGWVVKATASGVIQYRTNAPHILKDPTNPACFALRILLLRDRLQNADAMSVQLGRLWGRASIGLQYPEVAKEVQAWWLHIHRGPGGRKQNDLTRTLTVILKENPDWGVREIVCFLLSEEAKDRFASTADQSVFVTNVEFDEHAEELTYEDRSRKTHTIKMDSLRRKISDLSRIISDLPG